MEPPSTDTESLWVKDWVIAAHELLFKLELKRCAIEHFIAYANQSDQDGGINTVLAAIESSVDKLSKELNCCSNSETQGFKYFGKLKKI